MFRSKDFGQIKFDSKRVMAPPLNALEARPTTTSDRLVEFAKERGAVDADGNPDMSGLHMQQGAFEYVVNQHVATSEIDEPLIEERDWRLPRRGDPDRILRNFGRSSQRGGHIRIDKTSIIDLDVLGPDKKLLATLQFDGLDQFSDFMNSHEPEERRVRRESAGASSGHRLPYYLMNQIGNTPLPREPIDLDNLWWDETRPKAPAELEASERLAIEIPRHGGAEPFADVFQHREQLELAGELPGGSWFGLTMMKGAHKLQVVQDSMRYSPEPPGTRHARIFRIREYDEHGTEVRQGDDHPYTFDALRDLINGGKFTDIHWEVPATPEQRQRAIYRKLGWLTAAERAAEKAAAALELALLEEHINTETASIEHGGLHAVGSRNPARGSKLSKERRTAIWLLSGVNAETKEANQRRIRHMPKISEHNEHVEHRLEALEHIIEEQGLVAVFNLGLRLQKDFAAYAERLLLPLSEAALGDVSWAMESLANQYRADMRHGADPKVHSPFGDTSEARHRQHVIADLHLATVTAATVILHKTKPDQVMEIAHPKDPKDAALSKAKPGEELKQTIRMVGVHYVDPVFAVSLPALIKDEALEILQKIAHKDENLGLHDYIQLGALLRHAVDTTS